MHKSWVLLVVGLGLGCAGSAPADGGRTSATTFGLTSASAASGDDDTGTPEDDDETGSGTDTSETDSIAETESFPSCLNDLECPSGLVCAPSSGVCVPSGECEVDGDCPLEGFTCTAGTCTAADDCGDATFNITQVAPNVMVLLDRSGSMDQEVPGSGLTRWDVAKTVVNDTTAAFDDSIRFGLATFSACVQGQACSPGSVEIPLAPHSAVPINNFMNASDLSYLCQSGVPETSTGRSLDALVGNPLLQDPTRENAVLLITDGSESGECTPIDGAGGAANLYAQDISVRTFAVGFGFSGDQLDAIAAAGGTGQSYTADDQASLNAALESILGDLSTCTFALNEIPPDPELLYVFLNSDPTEIPVDALNGYTYDGASNSVTLHGSACEAISAGETARVDVVYGCPFPPPAG